ncbi:MAG: hypothetical protein LBP31_02195 [Holosporales bacterium]|jgi:hypothetical protein|nr:hypothetical protein [Holosporales bacterium]
MKSLYIVAASFLCVVSGAVASERPIGVVVDKKFMFSETQLYHDSILFPNFPPRLEAKLKGIKLDAEKKSKMIKENIREIRSSIDTNEASINKNTLAELEQSLLSVNLNINRLMEELALAQELITNADKTKTQPFESVDNIKTRNFLLDNVMAMCTSYKEIKKTELLVKARKMYVNEQIANKNRTPPAPIGKLDEIYQEIVNLKKEMNRKFEETNKRQEETNKKIDDLTALFEEFLQKK